MVSAMDVKRSTETAAQDAVEAKAFRESKTLATPVMVGRLLEVVPNSVVARLAGVSEPRAAQDWATERRRPHPQTEARLRLALHISLMIQEAYGAHAAEAWWLGLNPGLDDQAPADLLAASGVQAIGASLLAAARFFLTDG